MCQSVNLFRKIAVWNIGCVSAYFGGGHKINLRLWCCSSFNDISSNHCSLTNNNSKLPTNLNHVTNRRRLHFPLVILLKSKLPLSVFTTNMRGEVFFSFFHENNFATQKISGFWPDDSCLNQSLSITHEHEIYKSLDDEFEVRITFYGYI